MSSASTRDDYDDFEDDDRPPPFRPHPYTVEGYLLGMDDFASGAVAATGWRRTAAVVVAWAVLIPLGLGILVGIGRLLQLLLWR
ncbi:MAG: hypothetical protein JWN61_2390 [Pseudonocardiales bacterium]|nr:hypothetical protein [Jatrophihabitantaceae bacterium]MCW2604255.1 hypothetical protein [Pseudonocardiales bacterium]